MNLAQDHDAVFLDRTQNELLRIFPLVLEEIDEAAQMSRRIGDRRPLVAQPFDRFVSSPSRQYLAALIERAGPVVAIV